MVKSGNRHDRGGGGEFILTVIREGLRAREVAVLIRKTEVLFPSF